MKKNRMQIDDAEFPEDEKKPAAHDDDGEELPPITTLAIDVTDARGIRYQGAFVYKVPNMKDTMEIGRRKSLLLPVSVVNDVNSAMIAEMIAYLDVTLQKGDRGLPKWWKPLEFYDETPIVALYAEATAYAKKFRGEIRSDGGRAAREDEDGSSDDGGGMVDGDVPPPVERRTLHRTDAAGSASAGAARRGVQSGEG